jgi:hypothetical protein
MLRNNGIEPSDSPWSSPVLLVPKPDKTFCIDFRKVSALAKADNRSVPSVHKRTGKFGSKLLESPCRLVNK